MAGRRGGAARGLRLATLAAGATLLMLLSRVEIRRTVGLTGLLAAAAAVWAAVFVGGQVLGRYGRGGDGR